MKPLNVYNAIAPQLGAREQEALTFRLSSRKLREATERIGRNRALQINHEVWSFMFRDLNSSGNKLPEPLKSDCITLARWAMAYSTRAVLHDIPLQPLIELNDTVAEGLEAGAAPPAMPPAPVSAVPKNWASTRMSA